MSAVTWLEPPADDGRAKGREPKYLDIAAALRERPDEWALIAEETWATMANQIRSGGLVAFRPRGAFEARAVPIDGKPASRAQIFARFVGEPVKAADSPAPTTESEIRAAERERVAGALESARDETWSGGTRAPSNFGRAAEYVRGLS